MMQSSKRGCISRRAGVAAMWAVVVLAVLTTVIGAVTWQTVAGFRQADRRHAQLQALWLARSGVELAVAHLLEGEQYTGESTELIPHGQVKIQVNKDPTKADAVTIISEAHYPAGDGKLVVRVLTRNVQRMPGAGKALPSADPGRDH